MYAVISTGGKQYRVSKGDTIRIEKLDKKEGDKVLFDKVLLISDKGKVSIGKPFLEKGKIEGVVKAQGRDEKISIIKFNRRKHFKKQAGHRQSFTNVEITKIAEGKYGSQESWWKHKKRQRFRIKKAWC